MPPILKQYMEGQNKYFNFNGNVLVAEKGRLSTSKRWASRIIFQNEN